MTRYRWLLFDADNTLFDFDAAEDFALTRTLLHFGVEVTRERKARYQAVNAALWTACDRGETTVEVLTIERFARFLAGEGVEGDPAAWDAFYLDALSRCPVLLPGAEAFCHRLSQRYLLALVTNGVALVQRRRLGLSPLAPLFPDERVFISEEIGFRKPEKEYFDAVLDALGAATRKGEVLVLGDSLTSDIQGAFNAKLDSLWFNRSGTRPGPVRPTWEACNFAQASSLLLPPSGALNLTKE